jgi:excisionase family DNA binding protein
VTHLDAGDIARIADAVAERLASTAPPDRLLAVAEVAEFLGVSERWVRDATSDGRLPCVRLGAYRRYRRDEVLAYVAENSSQGRTYRPRGSRGKQ